MKWAIVSWIVLSTTVASAAPHEVDFASAEFKDSVVGEPENVQVSTVQGARVLVVSGSTARLRDMAVKPATKYTLSLVASFRGDAEAIEDNPRFEIFTRPGRTSPRLPSRMIQFLDADGKSAGQALRYALPFRNQRTYTDEFHTPAGAVTARITLASGESINLDVARLRLEETASTDVLNANPRFELGQFNYSGWKTIRDGGRLVERKGKTILDTKYGSTGQRIPLTESGTYAISAKGTGNGYNTVVILRVYDAAGKELMKASTRRFGPRVYFVRPPNAAYASFLVYSCLLEEVQLARIGDEQAIRKYQK